MARRASMAIEVVSEQLFAPEAGFPDFSHEEMLMARGARYVAGVDEAGRGPLAGPVVVAAVRLDPQCIPEGLNDSKKLTEERREALYAEIMACADVAIVSAPPSDILALNIRGATLAAMARAVRALPRAADRVLVDGRDVPPELPCPGLALIGGDGRSVSIAAASIVAKVTRDRMHHHGLRRPPFRLFRAQGLWHGGPSFGTGPAWPLPPSPRGLCPGGSAAGAENHDRRSRLTPR